MSAGTELDRTFGNLTRQRSRLTAQIEQGELSEDEICGLADFARQVAARIGTAGNDVGARRDIIDVLDVRGTLVMEDSRQVIRLTSVVNPDAVSIDTED